MNFRNNWIGKGAELFAESALLYQPILPESGDEDALAVVEAGDIPKLHELCVCTRDLSGCGIARYMTQVPVATCELNYAPYRRGPLLLICLPTRH